MYPVSRNDFVRRPREHRITAPRRLVPLNRHPQSGNQNIMLISYYTRVINLPGFTAVTVSAEYRIPFVALGDPGKCKYVLLYKDRYVCIVHPNKS